MEILQLALLTTCKTVAIIPMSYLKESSGRIFKSRCQGV